MRMHSVDLLIVLISSGPSVQVFQSFHCGNVDARVSVSEMEGWQGATQLTPHRGVCPASLSLLSLTVEQDVDLLFAGCLEISDQLISEL